MTGRVLITGASGFIGRALVADLAACRPSGAGGDAATGRHLCTQRRGGGGIRPDPAGGMACAAQGHRNGGAPCRYRPRRSGDRRAGLRSGQSPGDRRAGRDCPTHGRAAPHLCIFDPCAVRTSRKLRARRNRHAESDRRLWPLQARRRAGDPFVECALHDPAPGPDLRSWRQRQSREVGAVGAQPGRFHSARFRIGDRSWRAEPDRSDHLSCARPRRWARPTWWPIRSRRRSRRSLPPCAPEKAVRRRCCRCRERRSPPPLRPWAKPKCGSSGRRACRGSWQAHACRLESARAQRRRVGRDDAGRPQYSSLR